MGLTKRLLEEIQENEYADEREAWIREQLGDPDADESTEGWYDLSQEYDALYGDGIDNGYEDDWSVAGKSPPQIFAESVDACREMLGAELSRASSRNLLVMVYAHVVTAVEAYQLDAKPRKLTCSEAVVEEVAQRGNPMRGTVDPQSSMFHYFSAESRVPAEHPLRRVKELADAALGRISGQLGELYSEVGRPSIAPERLLKGQLLIALYSVRSDRMFCEQLDYNILFRWFLDMDLEQPGLDQSNFSRLRERLVQTDVAQRFFDEVVRLARGQHLLSSEHFTVDGTLIDAWASFKSFTRKDGKRPPPRGGDGSGMVDFKGEPRSNATHESTTDPQARLMRKGNGQPAKLSYGGHVLMENRSGLCVDVLITEATQAEHRAARDLLARARKRGMRARTLGADKGYHMADFVQHLRERGILPHIARIERRRTPGLDGRTASTEGYRQSQRKRKRVEEIFGWMKTVGGLRKTRFVGKARTQIGAYLCATAYNLLRMAKLMPGPAGSV